MSKVYPGGEAGSVPHDYSRTQADGEGSISTQGFRFTVAEEESVSQK